MKIVDIIKKPSIIMIMPQQYSRSVLASGKCAREAPNMTVLGAFL